MINPVCNTDREEKDISISFYLSNSSTETETGWTATAEKDTEASVAAESPRRGSDVSGKTAWMTFDTFNASEAQT
jgi:hypothetical protein